MAKPAERLVEGSLVYAQGKLTTRDRERTIKVPNRSAFIEHVVNSRSNSRRTLSAFSIVDLPVYGDDTESEMEGS